jgi:hypothetical protein
VGRTGAPTGAAASWVLRTASATDAPQFGQNSAPGRSAVPHTGQTDGDPAAAGAPLPAGAPPGAAGGALRFMGEPHEGQKPSEAITVSWQVGQTWGTAVPGCVVAKSLNSLFHARGLIVVCMARLALAPGASGGYTGA